MMTIINDSDGDNDSDMIQEDHGYIYWLHDCKGRHVLQHS